MATATVGLYSDLNDLNDLHDLHLRKAHGHLAEGDLVQVSGKGRVTAAACLKEVEVPVDKLVPLLDPTANP